MNDFLRALSFDEWPGRIDVAHGPRIATFHEVIFLPHGPNALRLSDVYAAGIPALVPEERLRRHGRHTCEELDGTCEEPLVQNFLWSSRTFGGLMDQSAWCHEVMMPSRCTCSGRRRTCV